MNVRVVYKTKEEFETDLSNDRLYEGFVIGVGYAYIHTVYQMPSNQNGYGRYGQYHEEDNRYAGFRTQRIDTSPEMVELSLRGKVSGEFTEIVIMQGDTLSGLAKELEVSVDDLARWNNIADTNKIAAGQTLLIDVNKVKYSPRLEKNAGTTSANKGADSNLSEILAAMRTPMGFIGYVSLAPTVGGGLKYTGNIPFIKAGGFWRGVNGQYYNMSRSLPGSGRGWGLRANSMNIARGASVFKYLRYGGSALGGISTVYSLVCFADDPNWEDGLDTGFGVAGLIYWPIGAVYFGGKLFYKGMHNYTNTMIENGLVPGRDDMIIWK